MPGGAVRSSTPNDHSALSAIIESTRRARRAGIQQARKAIVRSIAAMPAKVIGSEGVDAVEEALQEAGAGEGERQADERADRGQPHALADDELLDVGQLRAEGHAQADHARASEKAGSSTDCADFHRFLAAESL